METKASPKKMGIGKKALLGLAGLFIIGALASLGDDGAATTGAATEAPAATAGQAIGTDYFDVTLHGYEVADAVETGNQFADLAPEDGTQYLVISATFKNKDTESRMIEGGSVFINVAGKLYEFDKAEPVMAEGWGAMLEQINPLTTYTTKLVYKIPTGIKGRLTWEPGRNSKNTQFLLGEV